MLKKTSSLAIFFAFFLSACGGGNTGESSTSPSSQPIVSTCVLKTYSSNFPNSYLGSLPIPVPTQQFENTLNRMVGLKDYYPTDGANGCSSAQEYSRLMYANTLDRLKALGTDTVEIYQYGPVENFNASTWVINESNWQIPKSELIWFVQAAHIRNLKVTLAWQLWPTDKSGNALNTTNPSQAEMVKVLRGWKDIMNVMATLAAQNGIDNLNIQWSAFYYPVVTTYPEVATQEFLSIIAAIRSNFNGKLFMGTPRFYDQRILNHVDAVIVPLPPVGWNYTDDANMSVTFLKQRYTQQILNIRSDFTSVAGLVTQSVPIIWDFNIQSRNKAISDGWVEDGFCISSVNGPIVAWGSPNCMQLNYVTDFSVQAQAIEGAFQAVQDQTVFKNFGVNFSTGYWFTDTLIPSAEGFPNLSQSIRGKPAEIIVKKWFSR
jgi:hypothetical protein